MTIKVAMTDDNDNNSIYITNDDLKVIIKNIK